MNGLPLKLLFVCVLLCVYLFMLAYIVYFLMLTFVYQVNQWSGVSTGEVTPAVFKEVLVHLDFKGGPPRVKYLAQILPILSQSGATGLLLEWEDMLPYNENFASKDPYYRKEVFYILAAAENQGLSTIPLVPLYSDLDFVLKVKPYARLRQNFNDTRYICPNSNASLSLLFNMIRRVLDFHRDSKYFHIGFQGPFSQECQSACCKGQDPYDVIIDHLKSIIRHFHTYYPNIKLLMWDDLFRTLPMSKIRQLMGIGQYVIPVIRPFDQSTLVGANLETYVEYMSAIFPQVWISGGYKGLEQGQKFTVLPSLSEHLDLNWEQVDFVESYQHKFDYPITHFVLEGPQRNTHYSLLNELIPVCLPAMCLTSFCVRHKSAGYKGVRTLFRDLRCPPIYPTDTDAYGRCKYPGADVYRSMVEFHALVQSDEYSQLQQCKSSRYMQYNIQHRNLPLRVIRESLVIVNGLWRRLNKIHKALREQLRDKLLRLSDIEEWMEQNILPMLVDIKTMKLSLSSMKKMWHWPRRPFEPNDELFRELGNQTKYDDVDAKDGKHREHDEDDDEDEEETTKRLKDQKTTELEITPQDSSTQQKITHQITTKKDKQTTVQRELTKNNSISSETNKE